MPVLASVRDRLRGRKWPVVVLIVVMVVAAALLLAQDPRTIHVRSAYAIGAPEFPGYVASLVNAPLLRGSHYNVLANGDEIYAAMIGAIARARVRIEFETYNFLDGVAATRVAEALAAAARRGVDVRVIVDTVGATPPPDVLRNELVEAGVRLVWFNPVGMWTVEATNNRTHRKLLIVDGTTGFTGGAGVADHWLGDARNEQEWRDTQFEITGPVVQALEACFYENWVEAGGTDAPPIGPSPPSAPVPGDDISIVVWSNPTVGVSNVKLLYLYSVDAARQTIDIQSPYFVLDSSVRRALARARERGVKIRVLTDGEHTDAKSVKHASRNEYADLIAAGDRVFEYQPTMMHAKAMVIDRRWSIFGSANFDNRSLELNDEITIAADDPGLAATLSAAFEADLARSKEWTADEWTRRPWHWKAREGFWGLFGEVF
jgi:cardiolipin synthase